MLSIVIPTYNRVDDLPVLLESILSETIILEEPEAIDIVVSDNCSTDGTSAFVARFQCEHPALPLKYFRNNENVGFSRNVDLAIRRSTAEYALVMSDDDAFEKGALQKIVLVLKSNPSVDALVMSSNTYDATLRKMSARNLGSGVVVYRDGCDYLRECKGFPSALVSGCLFRVSAWCESFPESYLYSISVHMLVLTEMLLHHKPFAVIKAPLVKYRAGQSNCTWTKDNLYPFRFYLDSLWACKRYLQFAPADIFRALYRVPTRTIAFYIMRQKVVRHSFDATAFDEYYTRAIGPRTFYTILIGIFRLMPRWMLIIPYRLLTR